MKKKYTLILIGLLLSCSNNDDDGIDCSLFDPAFPELYIRLVDETGTNLIDNGTIDPDNITIEGNFSIREFDNTLLLYIPNESTFRYTVNLDDTDSVDIDFTAELTRIPCNISYFTPNGVEYNNVTIDR